MLTPKPHQAAGIDLLSRTPRLILADDMGLGKTMQAIVAAEELPLNPEASRVVICPSSAVPVWVRELAKMGITDVNAPRKGRQIPIMTRARWYIISLPLYRDNFQAFTKKVWPVGVLVLDEAHTIKDIASKSNKAATPLALRAPHCWTLSGTPIKNDYSEFFSLARIIIPHSVLQDHGVETFWKWRDTFCEVVKETIYVRGGGQRTVTKIAGSRNAERLRALIGPYMLRRTKKQVLKDLPELRWQPLHVDGVNLPTIPAATIARMEQMARDGSGSGDEHIATLRADWAAAMAPTAAEVIKEHVDGSRDPMIAFCSHLEAIDLMAAILRDAGLRVAVLTGSTNQKQRGPMEEAFQAGQYDVWLGQTLASGTAITLTRANRVLFVDLPWSPADAAQARDRAHRIGQTQEVLAQYLVSDDPLSERVISILAAKLAALEQLELA